jgi:DNA-binding PadR family transcriptional regulator
MQLLLRFRQVLRLKALAVRLHPPRGSKHPNPSTQDISSRQKPSTQANSTSQELEAKSFKYQLLKSKPMSNKMTALRLLAQHPDGLYGSEMVALSGGKLSRGTTYPLLGRMVKEGLVREVQEPATASLKLARTRHFITGEGAKAYEAYVREFIGEHREPVPSFHTQSA